MATKIFNVITKSSSSRCARLVSRPRHRAYGNASSGGDGKSSTDICNIPLSETVPWLSSPTYAKVSDHSHQTQVTTLDNGMRIASEEKFGQFCTVGVLVESGSRFETGFPSGVTHFLEKLAFSSTSMYASRDDILQRLEKHGGICDCQGSRDTLIYAASANTSGLEDVVELLSEVVLTPNITEDELEDARLAVGFDLENLDMRPDPEPLLVEMIHAAAYGSHTLGLPKVCPTDNLMAVNRESLYSYMGTYHTPDRLVLAGVGMAHDRLVKTAQDFFAKKVPAWTGQMSSAGRTPAPDHTTASYTGGLVQVEKDLSNVSLGPTPMPELAHCVIGLESCSHKDPDFIAFCVLNMLMGGGGSFSAGGPGKGMYTRLYLNVLNRFHWMHNATAYNHAYNDSGIFCIHTASHPASLKDQVEVAVREMVNTQHGISASELNRAKTQLQSMLLMNLESRPVMFEDIGRQVLSNRQRLPPQHYYDEIAKVTEDDVRRVARRMLSSAPSVAALGDLRQLPTYDDIRSALSSKDGRMPRRFSIFR